MSRKESDKIDGEFTLAMAQDENNRIFGRGIVW
jgi:hypothetical protein